MPRVSRTFKLSPRQPIEQVRCSACGRTWAVYEGRIPRMWSVISNEIFCDRRPCNAALARMRAAQGMVAEQA
jgi:hypothetical protein